MKGMGNKYGKCSSLLKEIKVSVPAKSKSLGRDSQRYFSCSVVTIPLGSNSKRS